MWVGRYMDHLCSRDGRRSDASFGVPVAPTVVAACVIAECIAHTYISEVGATYQHMHTRSLKRGRGRGEMRMVGLGDVKYIGPWCRYTAYVLLPHVYKPSTGLRLRVHVSSSERWRTRGRRKKVKKST